MFPAQLDTVYRLLHPVHPDHLAVIQRTGAGKTHILRTLSVMERGIVLIFIPLLMLSADVMSKFKCADQRFGAVAIQHLDELYDTNRQVYNELLEQCRGLLWSTTTTAFIFLSPQFLINHPDARGVFIECSHRATLCVVALDEAQIHVQHGTSFRSKIRALQVQIFAKIFGNQPRMKRPRLIVMMATMPTSYLAPLCRLLMIRLLSGDLILRGSENDFEQREIEMRTFICSMKGQFVSKGLTLLAEFIRDNQSSSVVVFCNSRKQSQKFWDNLERKLNEMKLNVDVIHINGSLHKTDKYWQIRLYCDKGHIREADYHVLVTTNAANVGIDKSSIALQVRFEWPRDLLTYFQEQGRARQRGTKSICVLYSDLSSYVSLVYQLLCGDDDTTGDIAEAEGSGECVGFDSAISPRRQVRRANTSQHDFALGPAAKKQLRARSLAELNEVMRFFCLNYGCLHERGEIYLSSGSLDSSPAMGHCTSCPIRNRTYHKDFLPVYRSGVESFLEWLTATAKLPFTVEFNVKVSSLLMSSPYWNEIIFDKSSSSVS
jgi:superfamily II DNA helicase RecQ